MDNVTDKNNINELVEYLNKNKKNDNKSILNEDEKKYYDQTSSPKQTYSSIETKPPSHQCSTVIFEGNIRRKDNVDDSKNANDDFQVYLFAKRKAFWPNNKTLKVYFMDFGITKQDFVKKDIEKQKQDETDKSHKTDETQKIQKAEAKYAAVMAANNKYRESILKDIRRYWSKCCNIQFEETVDIGSSDIRITFENNGAYSYIGNEANTYGLGKHTMNFSYNWNGDIIHDGTVLHEFGHSLAFKHEHSHPVEQIPYDKQKVYHALHGPPNNWSPEMVDSNIFTRPNPKAVDGYDSTIDKNSIMRYGINPDWLDRNNSNYEKFLKYNFQSTTLSNIDKQKAYRFYPFYYPNIGNKIQVFLEEDVRESFEIAMRNKDKDIIESYKYCGKKGIVKEHHKTNGIKIEFDENGKKISCWYEPMAVRVLDEMQPGFKVEIKGADYVKKSNQSFDQQYNRYCHKEGIIKEVDEMKGIKIQFMDDKELWYEPISFEIIDYLAIGDTVDTLNPEEAVKKSFVISKKEYIYNKQKSIYKNYCNATGIIKERNLMEGIKVQFGGKENVAWYTSLGLVHERNVDYYYKEIKKEERYFVNDWIKINNGDIVGTVAFNDNDKIKEDSISVKINDKEKKTIFDSKILTKLKSDEIWLQKKKIAGLSSYIDFSNKHWKCHAEIKIIAFNNTYYNEHYKNSWILDLDASITVTFRILKHWDTNNGGIKLKMIHLSSYLNDNPGYHSPINIYINDDVFKKNFVPQSYSYITNEFMIDTKKLNNDDDQENVLKIEAAKIGFKAKYWIHKLCICYVPKLDYDEHE